MSNLRRELQMQKRPGRDMLRVSPAQGPNSVPPLGRDASPALDFRIGCECPACELGVLLWYTEDEHPAREQWHKFWLKVARHLCDFRDWPCQWQLRRWREAQISK